MFSEKQQIHRTIHSTYMGLKQYKNYPYSGFQF